MASAGQLARSEGIIAALETAHAFAALPAILDEVGRDATVVVNVSGRGDKDMHTVMARLEQPSDEEPTASAEQGEPS